jgi:LacI family transcriptional regulator
MPIKKPVTLQSIAIELNLTVQTVSRALKGKSGMSEATRQLVFQTAERLGYYTIDQIRSLKLESIAPFPDVRYRFLLIQNEALVSYRRLLLQGLKDRLSTFGHEIVNILLPHTNKEVNIDGWLLENGIEHADGLFIPPGLPKQWESRLLRLPVPRILLGYPSPGTGIDSVVWDMYEATWLSVAHLREAGHRRIMYIGNIDEKPGYLLRWYAFHEAMRSFSGPVDPANHYTQSRENCPTWVEQLLEHIGRVKPSAIICGIDNQVQLVYNACSSAGWQIPGDLSMVGFLNEQPASLPLFSRPALPIWDTGYRAADRMLWRIANPSLPYEHIRIHGRFIAGSTTASAEE